MCQPTTTHRSPHLVESSIARHHQVTVVLINPCQPQQQQPQENHVNKAIKTTNHKQTIINYHCLWRYKAGLMVKGERKGREVTDSNPRYQKLTIITINICG